MGSSSGLDREAIRRQLDRVLASPEFHATDKMRAFLRFVVEEKLAGRSHRLKGYTVAVEVFGRGWGAIPAASTILCTLDGRYGW